MEELYGASTEFGLGGQVWDPLNLASDESKLVKYREAELKHGRVAMLATAGMLWQELAGGWTNGVGLFQNSGPYTALATTPRLGLLQIIIGCWIVENATSKTEGRVPGDIGFDPLGLSDEGIDPKLALAEVKHGRLCMLTSIAFILQSWISGKGVLATTVDCA